MMNLFLTFDPCTGKFSMNWMSTFMVLLILPKKIWKKNNIQETMINLMFKFLNKEMKMNTKYKSIKMMSISMMMFILINNMMGLLPYVFTSSSHLMFSLALSIPMWMSYMLFGWKKKYKININKYITKKYTNFNYTFNNFNWINKKFNSTLLSCHSIISKYNCSTFTFYIISSKKYIIIHNYYMMMFELAVSIIQSYVFMTLMSLYSSEV